MFASYVSEASPGCRYVLGARVRVSGAGRAGSAGATGATGATGADCAAARARATQQRRSTRLIAHTEYYYTLCVITATSRRPIFSPDLLLPLGFYFDLLARLISAKNLWILPKTIKESVDLPDFVKKSVAQIQILCTF